MWSSLHAPFIPLPSPIPSLPFRRPPIPRPLVLDQRAEPGGWGEGVEGKEAGEGINRSAGGVHGTDPIAPANGTRIADSAG